MPEVLGENSILKKYQRVTWESEDTVKKMEHLVGLPQKEVNDAEAAGRQKYSLPRSNLLREIKGRKIPDPRSAPATPEPVRKANPHDPQDVFISYRRLNGSELGTLIKTMLEEKNYTVFLDVETLAAGVFSEYLLNNIRMSKHFVILLTEGSLDRCIANGEQDWIYKEVCHQTLLFKLQHGRDLPTLYSAADLDLPK